MLKTALLLCRSRPAERSAEEQLADAVFCQAYIPRKLDEVPDFERDVDRVQGAAPTHKAGSNAPFCSINNSNLTRVTTSSPLFFPALA